MKIFISHSSKNRSIILKFARFLESIDSNIEVFCSSEKGSIPTGTNFVKTIFDELMHSDLFVPIISSEYFESKFCMIELGVAFSYLYSKYNNTGDEYIYPFALYPIQRDQALSGTPLANLQVGNLNDEMDIHNFLKHLSDTKGVSLKTGLNRSLHSFIFEIDQVLLDQQNIVEMARIGAYCGNTSKYHKDSDYINISVAENTVVLNYNMNPYEEANPAYPSFISIALRYVDKLDLGRYLDIGANPEFTCVVNNFTNSLKQIQIEFKYSESNAILQKFEFSLQAGDNELIIPLAKMKSNALHNISEICFVIHPDDVTEVEGMFKVTDIAIR